MESIIGFHRNQELFKDEGNFVYKISRKHKENTYFKCYLSSCHATAVLNNHSQNLKMLKNHTHEPDMDLLRGILFRQDLRCTVQSNPTKRPDDVYLECQIRNAEAAKIVSFKDVRNLIYKSRESVLPPVPSSMHDVDSMLKDNR